MVCAMSKRLKWSPTLEFCRAVNLERETLRSRVLWLPLSLGTGAWAWSKRCLCRLLRGAGGLGRVCREVAGRFELGRAEGSRSYGDARCLRNPFFFGGDCPGDRGVWVLK